MTTVFCDGPEEDPEPLAAAISAAIATAKEEPTHSAYVDIGADARQHKAGHPIYAEAIAAAAALGYAGCYVDGRSRHLVIPITPQGHRAAAEHARALAGGEEAVFLAELRGMVRRAATLETSAQSLARKIEATIAEWDAETAGSPKN